MAKPKNKKASKSRDTSQRIRAAKLIKLPKDAVTLIVQLRCRDGQHLLLEAELRALIAPTRKEEGCLQYDLHKSVDQTGAFLFHEVWASREHHTAHTKTPHFLRWNARKDSLLGSREASFWTHIG